MPKQDFQTMFKSGVHIGHRTQKWNPKMKKFIYGDMDGIHIINLEMTAKYLENALNFLSKTITEEKIVLFVSTKPQSIKLLENAAKDCGMPYVVTKWIPGLLTNFGTLKTRIKYLADLKVRRENGDFDKYTKKEVSTLNKIIAKLEEALGGVQNLKSMPDAVFLVDVVRDKIVVKEAKKMKIPSLGIVDTNSDPDSVNYPIPANDDSIKSIAYIVSAVVDVIKNSRKNKK